MQRRLHTAPRAPFLLLALTLAVLTACGGSDETTHATWRFAIEETSGSVQDTYAQEFKRRIEERTSGAVEVKVYPYGTLGTSDDLTEQLRMGSLQLAMASPGHLGKTIPEVQAFLLHFLLPEDDRELQAVVRDARVHEQLQPLFGERDLALLSILPEGWMVWTTQKEVRTPADFAGVKIRTMTSPLLLAAYEAYGASPQAMPYGEVYGGLQLNMIDAQVNPVFAIEEMSFYEVTSHMVFAKHAPFLTTLVANEDFLASLDPEVRTTVDDVLREMEPWLYAEQRRLNEERLAEIREKKPEMVVVELTEDERAAFRALAEPVREAYLERTGTRGAALLAVIEEACARAGE